MPSGTRFACSAPAAVFGDNEEGEGTMGKHRATGTFRRAAERVVVVGAIPLTATLIGTGAVHAEAPPVPPASAVPVVLPTHSLLPAPGSVADPFHEVITSVEEATRTAVQAATDTIAAAAAPFIHPVPPAVLSPAPAPISATRPLPNHAYLAPQDALHTPVPVPPVQPIEAPPGTLRLGDIIVNVPFEAREFNQAAAQTEAQLATFLDSMGVERSRSDRIAARTLASAAVGAAVANAVAAPVAIPFAMFGAVAGFVSGIPFLPTGLVVGPVIGATIGYGVVEVPAMIAGAALGGVIGAIDGFTAPSFGVPPR